MVIIVIRKMEDTLLYCGNNRAQCRRKTRDVEEKVVLETDYVDDIAILDDFQ